MPSISHPSTIRKLGAIYSWLMRQPHAFTQGVQSITDAERLYDAYAMAGVENIFDNYDSKFAIAAIGYDPASVPVAISNERKGNKKPLAKAV